MLIELDVPKPITCYWAGSLACCCDGMRAELDFMLF